MKKIFAALAITFLGIMSTSCLIEADEPVSGTAIYSFGMSRAEGDISEIFSIEQVYTSEFAKIPEATVSGGKVTIEGSFSKSDKAVFDACKTAESKVTKPKNCNCTFHVSAAHINGKVIDTLYEKSFNK